MSYLKKILLGLVSLVTIVALAACNKGFKGTAQDFINLLSVSVDRQIVSTNFEVPLQLTQEETTVEVQWTSKDTEHLTFEKGEKTVTGVVTRPEADKEDAVVEFTGSVTYKGETASADYKIKVPRQLSPAEEREIFWNSTNGTALSLSGYIGALGEYAPDYGNFSLYMIDQEYEGGYYVFRAKASQELYDQLEVGTAISVSGKKGAYAGAPQVDSGSTIAINEELPAFDSSKVKEDITDAFIKYGFDGVDKNESELYRNVSNLVTIKGLKVKSVETDFTKANKKILVAERAGKELQVNFNGYLFNDAKGDAAKELFNAAIAKAKVGEYIDVTGFFTFDNSNYVLNIVSADDIVKTNAPAASNEEKIISELVAVESKFSKAFTTNTNVDLPTQGATTPEVKLAYELDNKDFPESFKIEGNKLIITAKGEAQATLKVTATLGELTLSYNITVATTNASIWEQFRAAEDGAKIGEALPEIKGVITVATFSGKDDNDGTITMFVQDANGGYYVRMTGQKKADAAKLVPGTEVTIKAGEKTTYNGLYQLQNVNITDLALGEKVGLPKAVDISKDMANLDKYQSMLVTVTGTGVVKEKDLFLKVADTEIKYYFDYKICPDASKPTVSIENGKTYTFTGVLVWFNAAQLSPIDANSLVVAK